MTPTASLRSKLIAGFFLCATITPTLAAETNKTAAACTDLVELNLEDLMRVKVTSVSKHPEQLAGAAAAIYVLTPEEIERQGFTTIADSLRTVPGLEVGQVNSHSWAVSSRGFNGELASKLLVLMDGRSVYTPLFAGVYWDVQDAMLEDLNRIEVIRGPGATLWGANAVNGVINIISKSAKDTQGLLVSGGGGTEERGFGGVRYGGKLAENVYYRVYTKYSDRDDTVLANGASGEDSWWMARSGFRVDWDATDTDLLTFQGDVYDGREHLLRTTPAAAAPFTQTGIAHDQAAGGNFLSRWSHSFSEDSEIKWQTYYDYTRHANFSAKEDRHTFDTELQYRFQPLARHDVVAGLGYQRTADELGNSYDVSLQPDHRADQLFSAFVQDEVTLIEDRLRLTLGSKFEHNDYTGFEWQPSVRLAWTPTERQTVWAAVSRAVRTPARAEDDVRIRVSNPNLPPPFVVTFLGDASGDSEELLAYELGYRVLPHPRLSFDVATFYNDYDHLRSLTTNGPAEPFPSAATLHSANNLKGQTYGVEVAADWQILDAWRLRGAYTYFHIQLQGTDDANTIPLLEGNTPRHEFSLRSMMDLPHQVTFDCGVRYVDSLSDPYIASYLTLDVRLAWRITPNLELSLVGLNLIPERHTEFAPEVFNTPLREVQQSMYAKITWRF